MAFVQRKTGYLHGNVPDTSPVTLLLIDVISDRCCLFLLILGLALSRPADAQAPSPNSSTQQASHPPHDREVSIRELPGNLIHDQKQIWSYPFKPERINRWWPPVISMR